jgi:Pentapeptide repeats (9 copies)
MAKNARDPGRKRATYNVTYPLEETVIDRVELDRLREQAAVDGRITAKKITWNIKFSDVPPLVFDQCNFHVTKGVAETEITSLTFQGATFTSCFLGTILFRSVRFKNCHFLRCDLSHAHFEDCLFEDCEFVECSAWSTRFTGTVIDPRKFLDGVGLPLANFADKPDEKPTIEQGWVDEQARLAGVLLRSNEDCKHAKFSEAASHLSKSKNLAVELQAIMSGRRSRFLILSLVANFLVMKATRGGTSLSRLAWIAIGAILLLSFLLPEHALVTESATKSVVSRLMGAASGFFGFGFTNLRLESTRDIVIGTIAGSLGLLWFALFAAVLIRRFYR